MTNFELVSDMNEAFGNPKGDPANINWSRIVRQTQNILDEFIELQKALGASDTVIATLSAARELMVNTGEYAKPVDLDEVRDALTDIHVFAYGANHLMGIDADRDMKSVIDGLFTRFIKDEKDEIETIKKHSSKGVVSFYLEGEYPRKVLKSAGNYPDAPKDKFLKSASAQKPVFYKVTGNE